MCSRRRLGRAHSVVMDRGPKRELGVIAGARLASLGGDGPGYVGAPSLWSVAVILVEILRILTERSRVTKGVGRLLKKTRLRVRTFTLCDRPT